TLVIGGRHNDQQFDQSVNRSENLQGIKSANFGHLDIQKHEVDTVLLDAFQQLLRIFGQSNLIAFAFHPAGKHVPVHFIVIDDEQAVLVCVHDTFFSTSKLSIFSLTRTK